MAHRAVRFEKQETRQQEVALDPASIMLYIRILVEVIRLVRKCRKSNEVINSAQQPTMFEIMVVKRVVRKNMSFRDYFKRGREVVRSVFRTGATANIQEIEQLYKEV